MASRQRQDTGIKIVAGQLPDDLKPLFQEFVEGGYEHPEIRRRQAETRSYVGTTTSMVQLDYWKFIDDAIRGVGGFQDGSYIFPHQREIVRGTTLKRKALARIEMADYDNFAGVIAGAPWGYISQSADMIKRDPQDVEGLDEFWQNVDGNRTSMLDFLEYPFLQARAYGTAFVRVDRPGLSIGDDQENREVPVVLRSLPTAAFRWWTVDKSGNLTGVVYCIGDSKAPDIYIWGLSTWATLIPVDSEDSSQYMVADFGYNPLADEGRLPFVRLHDHRPGFNEGLGQSIMLNVAKIARQVYNTDSELVELRRHTAFPFLALPMKTADPEAVRKLEIGTASAVPHDGDGGSPKWIAPELEAMVRLAEYREKKKEQAYGMAHMAAVVGYIQTTSGFHAEAEFDKTRQEIGRCASALEAFETEVISMWGSFRGIQFDMDNKPTVEYPREFGIRDLDKVYERTTTRLAWNLGENDLLETLRDLYQSLYPRTPKDEIERLAKAGVAARVAAREEMKEQMEEKEKTPKDDEIGVPKLVVRGKYTPR